MNLPRGKLIDTLKGGPEVLRKMLIDLGGRDFNGYIKVDYKRDGMDSHGIIIVMGSKAVMAVHIWKERIFGHASLRYILRDTLEERCSIKLFSLPDEARAEMTLATHKFTSARINIDNFDIDKESHALVQESFLPAEVAAVIQQYPIPSGPRIDEEAAALYTSMSEIGVDTTDLKKKEEELSKKEKQLRAELDEKLKERDQLKAEEENFLKMDEVFSKLLKQREEERAEKEVILEKKMEELQHRVSRREEDIANREDEIKKEIERLAREKEEMKHREEKLLEMEKMFRRVLTNTEERLKRKEEELLRKEEELEKVVRQRMSELEQMKAQAALVQRTGETGSTELVKIEEALRLKEMMLKRKEEELEDRVREFRRAVMELEKRKAAIESGAPVPPEAPKGGRCSDDELQRMFRSLDSLLERLPDEAVSQFASSKDFELYESLMNRLGLAKKQ